MARPNVLVIMTDQERYPPPYEGGTVARWRRDALVGREQLRARSVELHRHYVAATACVPSRTSLFTGQYPTLHGAASTDGLAKTAEDPTMVWLDPDQVPTMGDWFRAGGYRTEYRGKWHLSHADLIPAGAHRGIATNDEHGVVDAARVEAYRRAGRLEPFGFSGWIGREPHGVALADTGLVRDELFADQAAALAAELVEEVRPWLAVISFVNPHDIAFTGGARQMLGFPELDPDVPDLPAAPSQDDGFTGRPSSHAQFVRAWAEMLFAQPTDAEYRRFYLWLHRLVDRAIERTVATFEARGLLEDTVVVLTSDHGDLLGAHGGLQQKWYNAFDEALHVPLLISGPGIEPDAHGVDVATSHVDLLPTLLGLVGLDPERLAPELVRTHVEVRPPVGRDLSPALRGEATAVAEPVYFMTEDQISRGLRTTNLLTAEPFRAVQEPGNVESVVAALSGSAGAAACWWKLNRYYQHRAGSRGSASGEGPEEWELHDLTNDPQERHNLAADPEHETVRSRLVEVLDRVRAERCLTPTV